MVAGWLLEGHTGNIESSIQRTAVTIRKAEDWKSHGCHLVHWWPLQPAPEVLRLDKMLQAKETNSFQLWLPLQLCEGWRDSTGWSSALCTCGRRRRRRPSWCCSFNARLGSSSWWMDCRRENKSSRSIRAQPGLRPERCSEVATSPSC